LASKNFWAELTGDEALYIKLIRFMTELPEKYVADFDESYTANRLVKEFTNEFCNEDGSIDWENLLSLIRESKRNNNRGLLKYTEVY